mmetsp:Transcript_56631/g.184210  ORF Transcript_56631/g.184210 Transcript_56631/m.184210 type:complete len:200 (-) Transcript_56631:497-1096(-)
MQRKYVHSHGVVRGEKSIRARQLQHRTIDELDHTPQRLHLLLRLRVESLHHALRLDEHRSVGLVPGQRQQLVLPEPLKLLDFALALDQLARTGGVIHSIRHPIHRAVVGPPQQQRSSLIPRLVVAEAAIEVRRQTREGFEASAARGAELAQAQDEVGRDEAGAEADEFGDPAAIRVLLTLTSHDGGGRQEDDHHSECTQ